MTIEIQTITPELAQQYLGTQTENRSLRITHVLFLRDEIIAGAWKLTHQPIAFDENGRLIDGQHRLHAVALSGRAVEMHVARGVRREFFAKIDQSVSRTLADRLCVDSRITEVLNTAYRLATGVHNRKASTDQCKKLLTSPLGAAIGITHEAVRGTKRALTCVAVRMAVALSICERQQEHQQRVLGQYSHFYSGNFSELEPGPLRLSQLIQTGEFQPRKGGSIDSQIARTWHSFGHLTERLVALQEARKEALLSECRNIVKRYL